MSVEVGLNMVAPELEVSLTVDRRELTQKTQVKEAWYTGVLNYMIVLPLENEFNGNNDIHTMYGVILSPQTMYSNPQDGGRFGGYCSSSVLKKTNVLRWMNAIQTCFRERMLPKLELRVRHLFQTDNSCSNLDLCVFMIA